MTGTASIHVFLYLNRKLNQLSVRYQFALYGLLLFVAGMPAGYAQQTAALPAEWLRLRQQPVTETTFRQTCDYLQDLGQQNLPLAFTLLARYESRIRKTNNRRWLHILLIHQGKGYESLNRLAEAEPIFRKARQNAAPDPQLYSDALTYTVQLYMDWEKPDSVERYLPLGLRIARQLKNPENLAFLQTFRALTWQRKGNPDAMRAAFGEAIRTARLLSDKNALFMAWFNRTTYALTTPAAQMPAYDSLLTLTRDSSLIRKPRFYERTTLYFRNPRPTVLYNLVQLNLLLTDYDNAGAFAGQVYDELIRPNPGTPLAPYMHAEMALVKCYQRQFGHAQAMLDSSRRQFNRPEHDIPYATYFLAAGLLAEHRGQLRKAADLYRQTLHLGTSWVFSRIPPEIFYARTLTRLGNTGQAARILRPLLNDVRANRFSATGLYYYEVLAGLQKRNGNLAAFSEATDTYYSIRDSLTNLNQYRAVQQIMARVRLRDKEQQIARLHAENTARTTQLRRERRFYGIILLLAGLTIGLLILYLRNRQTRARQREALQQSQLRQLEQQHQLDVMTGAIEAGENERRKIAGQLHDDVNPMLALATLNVSSALEKGLEHPDSPPKIRRTQSVLATVSATIRGISHRLTPMLVEQYGLAGALDDLAGAVNAAGQLQLHIQVTGFENNDGVSYTSHIDIYRIVQELVHNILKHAQATEALIDVTHHGLFARIAAEDNGIGLSPDTMADGLGLRTIRSKVSAMQGTFTIQVRPGGGTLIILDHLHYPADPLPVEK